MKDKLFDLVGKFKAYLTRQVEQEDVQVSESEEVIEEQDSQEEVTSEIVAEETSEEKAKRKKREWIFELALFFILGVLLGVTIKTEAVKRVTIGFNDYQIRPVQNAYNMNALKQTALQKQQEAQQQAAGEQLKQQAQTQSQSAPDQSQASGN
ncbi:MAG TPA: hypothetical protein VF817_04185 [Patescibacteria group bacterium]